LEREGDPDGIKGWTEQKNNGLSIREIVRAFGHSEEYQQRFVSAVSGEEAARLCYKHFLDREPESAEVKAGWAKCLADNGYRAMGMDLLIHLNI